jgi:hypothetical protein
MTRDRDQQPRRSASADDAFLEVTGARAKATASRTRPTPRPRPERDESGRARAFASEGEDATDATDTTNAPRATNAAGNSANVTNTENAPSPEKVREHLRRRAIFLRELAEARELRERVTPHRSRRARIHAALRRRTFRLH